MSSFVVLFVVACIYFLPTIVAANKKRPNTGAIFTLNLLLGWTLLGWVITLVWATTAGEQTTVVVTHGSSAAHELEKLAELKTKGVISEGEFEARKKKILEA